MMKFDFYECDADRNFRNEVREFVARYLPDETRYRVEHHLKLKKSDYVNWQRILFQHGWFPGPWPTEFGGAGWSTLQYGIFLQENGLGGAPMIMPYGVSMIGPILYTFGNREQQERFLPGIRDSGTWWCQGYSEPNAGSDLASLKTRAELKGDHYVVTGTKMWTTEAHWADWMHCLVRTSTEDKPQRGITYLMIDMKSRGLTVEPIKTMDGIFQTNQTFLDNVEVPVENRIGAEGEGWKMARFLLDNERSAIADTGTKMFFLNGLEQRLNRLLEAGVPDRVHHQLLEGFHGLRIRMIGLCALEKAALECWASNTATGLEGSILKIRSTELYQAMGEFGLHVAGLYANSYDAGYLSSDSYDPALPWQATVGDLYHYLYGRAWTIFGGTSEIQRNLIARSLI